LRGCTPTSTASEASSSSPSERAFLTRPATTD
jgi:hypothetical protein